jgi:hypothetical protein
MRTVKVAARDLLFALENRVPGTTHYLDTETGEVIPAFSYNREKILADVQLHPNRFVRLAPQSGRDGFRVMEEFARTVSRPEIRARLDAALKQEHVFREFRAAVDEDPDERRRWQQFRGEALIQHVRKRLASLDVSLELIHGTD